MTRNEYIQALLPGVRESIVHFVGAERERRARAMLDQYSTSELSLLYSKQVAGGSIKPPTPAVNVADIEAARSQGAAELEALREQHRERLSAQRAERAADRILFQRQQEEATRPQRQEELVRARQVIAEAQLVLRNFALNEANISLLLSVIDPTNISLHAISQAIASNAVTLSPATAEEHERFRLADIESHNQRLLSMNPAELKAEVRRESGERATHHHEQESNRVLAAQQKADSYVGYPEMPLVNSDGVKLDSRFFRRATAATIRVYIRRYGNAQITNAIRNRN